MADIRLWGGKPHFFGEINLGAKAHSSGEVNLPSLQPTLIFRRHCEKYSSKLDIYRSFIRIFAFCAQEATLILVILSKAKNLNIALCEIFHYVQNDRRTETYIVNLIKQNIHYGI